MTFLCWYLAGIQLLEVNYGSIRAMCEMSSKLTIKDHNNFNEVVLVPSVLTLNRFHTFVWCFYCPFWVSKCLLDSVIQKQFPRVVLCTKVFRKHFSKFNRKTPVMEYFNLSIYLFILWTSLDTKLFLSVLDGYTLFI